MTIRQIPCHATSMENAITAADEPKNRTWRPFRLAFLLLNLPAPTAHVKKLSGGRCTGRHGRWRVLYEVDDAGLRVARLLDRKDAYRR